MVEQTVEQCGSQRAVAIEDAGPLAVHPVCRDQGGAALVAVAQDLEQAVGAGLVNGQVAEFVNAQQRRFDEVVQRALDAAGGLRAGQRVDDVDGAGEQHPVPAQAGSVAERGHQVAFAQASAGDEHHVGVLGDEVQAEQVLYLQAVDLGGPVPVERVQRLEHREAGVLDAPLDPAVGSGGGFAAHQFGEVVQMRPVLVRSGLRHREAVLADEGQVQLGELRAQDGGRHIGQGSRVFAGTAGVI